MIVHMISDTCYNDQRGPVYQEDGYTIETRPAFPYKEERNEQLEKVNLASNVLTKSTGAGYPEVIQGASQMKAPLKNSDDTTTHDKNNVNTNLGVNRYGKANQDHESKTKIPYCWEDIPVDITLDPAPNLCEKSK